MTDHATNALATTRGSSPVFEMIQTLAPTIHQSRLFGVSSPEQAAAIMMRGYELGLSLTNSFEFIHVIDGKPSLSPRGMLALLHQSKLVDIEIVHQPQACTCTMVRRDTGFRFSYTFSVDDARRAGLVKPNGGWDKYPQQMCQWRVIGFVADVVAPDILGGMKRSDELGAAIDQEGNVVEVNDVAD